MKRDMDLIRNILLELEGQPAGERWAAKPMNGYAMPDVVEHVKLAHDAHLVDARFVQSQHAMVLRMLNEGYDFLEASKQQGLWELAKQKLISAGLPLTLDALKTVLTVLISEGAKKIHL